MSVELRHVVRSVTKRPAFSTVIVLTIGLGIAATTTAFSVVNGVLLEPLPYDDPEALVYVWEHNFRSANDRNVVGPANFIAWRERSQTLTDLSAVITRTATLIVDGEAERAGIVITTPDLLPTLGVRPLMGRVFSDGDGVAGAEPVAILSEAFWRARFGADPGILGRSITLDGRTMSVIGILPSSFVFESQVTLGTEASQDVWVPFPISDAWRTARGRSLQVIGRLRPGVAIEAAQRDMSALARRLEEEQPERQRGWGVNIVPMRTQIAGDVSRTLLVIFGAVAAVLLIACANVANLLLTRATERHQEVAVRAALGASRWRVARQMLLESLLLAGLGGGLGILLANWAVEGLLAIGPDIPRLDSIDINGTVMLFAIATTLGAGLLFGMMPALQVARSDLATWLRSRQGGGGRVEAKRMRGALVVTEIALSLVLLIGAGLLLRSLTRLIDVGIGFDTRNLLTATIDLPDERYDETQRPVFFDDVVQRLRARPGVEAASAITFAPLGGPGTGQSFWVNDRPIPEAGQLPGADIRWVHRDYFSTMEIPLVAGRWFDGTDRADAPMRVVVSEALQKEFWPGRSAVGQRLSMPWGDTLVAEIIGVAADIRHTGPNETPRAMIYWNVDQFNSWSMMTLVVRTTTEPTRVGGAIREIVRAIDPELPVYEVRTMESALSDALVRSRFAALSLGVFAALALILACIGIYGVISYATGQRIQEFGVRMALGADPGDVVRLVVRQGATLVGIALVVGLAGAVALARVIENLLYGIGTTDPLTFVAMSGLLGIVALTACWIPARRAASVSPVAAMRQE